VSPATNCQPSYCRRRLVELTPNWWQLNNISRTCSWANKVRKQSSQRPRVWARVHGGVGKSLCVHDLFSRGLAREFTYNNCKCYVHTDLHVKTGVFLKLRFRWTNRWFVKKVSSLTVQFALGSDFGAPNNFSQTSIIVLKHHLILIFYKTERCKNPAAPLVGATRLLFHSFTLAVFILSFYISYSLLSHTCPLSHTPIDPQYESPSLLTILAYLAIIL
jgi:hypothetical protein